MAQKQNSLLNYLLPRLQAVLFIALLIAVIGLGPRMLNIDGDLGRHLTVGEYILQNGRIPTHDIFSHTMTGQPLTPHEWLAQVIFALAYRLMGLDGVVLICALLIALTFTLVYQQAVQRSGLLLASVVFAIAAAAAASLHWLARPHLWTMLMVVLWVGTMEDLLRHKNSHHWWRGPLLMLFWVNLHGAFIAGFVIWIAYGIGYLVDRVTAQVDNASDADRQRQSPPVGQVGSPVYSIGRKYLAVGGVSLLVTLLNPVGWQIWTTSLSYVSNRYLVAHTGEYLSPNFQQMSTWPFLGLIVLSLLMLGLGRAWLPGPSVLLLAGWTALGLYSARNVPLYALIAAPILAEASATPLRKLRPLAALSHLDDHMKAVDTLLRGHLWPALSVVLVTVALFYQLRLDFGRQGNRFDSSVFPVAAVDWLATHPPAGKVFNYFSWGGYLLYRTWPAQNVFIDGQTDFYGEALTRQYEQVITLADGWQGVLRQYQVNWVLMPSDSALVQALHVDPDWQIIYHDPTATVLIHRP